MLRCTKILQLDLDLVKLDLDLELELLNSSNLSENFGMGREFLENSFKNSFKSHWPA